MRRRVIGPSGAGTAEDDGVVQAMALAPTRCEAEVRSKAVLLSGPEDAPARLPHGGTLVFDDQSHASVEPTGPVGIDPLDPPQQEQNQQHQRDQPDHATGDGDLQQEQNDRNHNQQSNESSDHRCLLAFV